MNKKMFLGSFVIILGGILLSLQVYCLKFIQLLEATVTGSYLTNAFEYIYKAPMAPAVMITIAIIVYGIALIIQSKKEK